MKRLKSFRLHVCAALCCLGLCVAPAHAQNLVTNGGFEEPEVLDLTRNYEHRNGTELTGWTSFSTFKGTVQFNSAYAPVSEGNQAVQIEIPGDSISQTFPTIPGQEYLLSFDLSGFGDGRVHVITVTVANVALSFISFTPGSFEYATHTIEFEAQMAETTVTFTNTGTRLGSFPHVDNVSVTTGPGGDQLVDIDINPRQNRECVNQASVVIFGSGDFDVTNINADTLAFGENDSQVSQGPGRRCWLQDVNSDGLLDLVCQFVPGSGEATLHGELFDGTSFQGTGSICVTR